MIIYYITLLYMERNEKINCGCGKEYPEKRWTQFLILRVLYEKPSYGYEIVKSIEDLTEGRHQIKYGTAYILLRRMKENNLLTFKWEKSEKTPDKKIYRVTKKGEKLLKMWLETIIKRKKMMNKLTSIYEKHSEDKIRKI